MRQSDLALVTDDKKEWDLVVVGGGLLGAAIALEAATSGLQVLLVEKDDFASGSSSRTSKIAGAASPTQLNQSGHFGGSAGAEYLHRIAPHLVKDVTFLMPIAPGRMLSSLGIQMGLTLNDLRSGRLGKNYGHKRLSRKETLRASVALAPEMVTGGLRFHDYFADDSRLVIELIKAARNRGAVAINYLEAAEFACDNGRVQSIVLKDRLGGARITIKPRSVVSACGVWSDVDTGLSKELIKNSAEIVPDEPIVRLRSTHIILPASALETNGAALLLAGPDAKSQDKYVFVVPWQRALLIGTTSHLHEGDIEDPLPSTAEIDYLLHAVNQYTRFDRKVMSANIACAWAGLSIAAATSNPRNKPQVYRGANAVIIAYGGHLANFSDVAREAVRFISYQLGNEAQSNTPAPKSDLKAALPVMLGGFVDKQEFLVTMAQIAVRARKLGLDPASLDHLCTSYGKDSLIILDLLEADPALNERICPDFPQLMAEVAYIIDNEMAVSLEDVLCRRIRLGFLHREQCLDAAPRVAKMMQEKCGWDSMRLRGELSNLARRLASQLAPVG